MKERFKKIKNVLLVVFLSVAGMWEYMQFFMYHDFPQAVVVLPIIGFLAGFFLKKWGFLTLATTALMSLVFQWIQSPQDTLGYVETSKVAIILQILPAVLAFLLLGILGGLVASIFLQKERNITLRILCLGMGIILTLGSGIFLFRNPLYPFVARQKISQYAKKYDTKEYPVSEVNVYYSFSDLEYLGRVVMSDGVIHPLAHHRSTGEVTEENAEEKN